MMAKWGLVVLWILWAGAGISQNRLYIGPVAGYQLNTAYIEHTVYDFALDNRMLGGYLGGINVRYYNPHRKGKLNTGIQLAVQYQQKGWKQKFILSDPAVTRLNYLTIPFDALIYAGNERNRVYARMGLYFEFLMNHVSSNPPDSLELEQQDFFTYDPDRDKTFTYGILGGMGMQKDFKFGSFFLEGFFYFNMGNVIGFETRAEPVPDTTFLWGFGGSLGYLIPIGKREDETP